MEEPFLTHRRTHVRIALSFPDAEGRTYAGDGASERGSDREKGKRFESIHAVGVAAEIKSVPKEKATWQEDT